MILRDETQLAELFRLACHGDERAYHQFLRSISAIIRAIIQSKAGGLAQEEQEDILQEVLFTIHNKRHSWRQDRPVKPWVYAIARYKIIDAFRARGKASFVDFDEFSEILPVDAPDAQSHLDAPRLLNRLSGKPKTVVTLIAIDGLSIEEAAQKLGMTQVAVRVNFHRALDKLRKMSEEDR